MHVDHSAPIHDNLCRCRACKPPLVGDTRDSLARLHVCLGGLMALTIMVIAIRA